MPNKHRMMAIFSFLLVSGFVFTSLASYYVSRDSLLSEIRGSALPLTSDTIYSEIQRDLLQPISIASFMAHDTFLRDWVTQGENDEAKIRQYLAEIMHKYGTFTAFFVSEKTSTYYHANGVLKKVRPDEERDRWYYRVRAMSQPFEINVDPDLANSDAMTIFVNYRVFDREGNFIGATGVGLTVTAVKRLIEDYQLRYHRRVFFSNRQGDIVLHGSGFPDGWKSLSTIPGLAPHIAALLASRSLSFDYQGPNGLVLSNVRFIEDFGWYLLVEQDERENTGAIYRALVVNLLICAGITLVVLFFTHRSFRTYQAAMERMASTDKLTGCHTRAAFDILFAQARKNAERTGGALSLIIMDVDWFKNINDSYGHLMGDQALRQVAEIFRRSVRQSDVICRWGGEEFLVLLPQCDLAQAAKIAEAIRAAIDAERICAGEARFSLTASFGVGTYRPSEAEDVLLQRADDALYRAKKEGRNRVVTEDQAAPKA